MRRLFSPVLEPFERALANVNEDVRREAGAREELRSHLETRLTEVSSALADVRGAYLTTRGEFERTRDEAIPGLEKRLDRVAAALQAEMENVRDRRLPRVEEALASIQGSAEAAQRELEALRDERFTRVETDLHGLQSASDTIQGGLEALRDRQVPRLENDLLRLQGAIDSLQGVTAKIQALGEELRDARLPAVAARTDALVGALHEELAAVGGLVDRLAMNEPLRVAVEPEFEARIPAAIAAASTRFVDSFRGQRAEILGRVGEYVPRLAEAAPVLDIGCGRGELLEALRGAGVEACGVDSDPAMVAACRRQGLAADEGDALGALRGRGAGTLGAVTAIHLIEHLPAAVWMSVVEAAFAALRSGGLLLVESPNPDSLRVGAGLFWVDPTHRVPVHPDALEFVMKALGFEVVEKRLVRPFPPEQALATPDQPEAVRQLAARLDAWLSGPRDFVVLARKP